MPPSFASIISRLGHAPALRSLSNRDGPMPKLIVYVYAVCRPEPDA
jgi:hypothetical protein